MKTFKTILLIGLIINIITSCHAQNSTLTKPSTSSENHPQMVRTNKEIKFITTLELGKTHLEEVLFEIADNNWTSLKIILKTDVETNRILEQHTFFNNKAENRLDEVEGGFNTSLPVFMELELDADNFHLLPDTSVDLTDYFDNLPTEAELLQENKWNLLSAWQAHQLDPSIGGGILKVGYQTCFTKPQNKIDALKRKGMVSKAVVTALIENQFPVHFNDDVQSFETTLMLENKTYTAIIKPDDNNVSLTINLLSEQKIKASDRVFALQVVEKANKEITIGELTLNENSQFCYFHYMKVSKEMINHQWVTEMLLAGLSLIHHYQTVDPSFIQE